MMKTILDTGLAMRTKQSNKSRKLDITFEKNNYVEFYSVLNKILFDRSLKRLNSFYTNHENN